MVEVKTKNAPLDEVDRETVVSDPQNQITSLILYIFSFQTFIPTALGQAARYEDESKD